MLLRLVSTVNANWVVSASMELQDWAMNMIITGKWHFHSIVLYDNLWSPVPQQREKTHKN